MSLHVHVQLFAWNVIIHFCIVTGLRWACLSSSGLIAIGSALRCVTDDPYAAKWQVTPIHIGIEVMVYVQYLTFAPLLQD